MGEREFEAFGITASQAFGAVAVAPAVGREFRGSVQVLHAGDVRVGDIRSSPLTVSRSASLIRTDDTELYKLALSCRGRAIIGQDGRCTELRPSDLVVYDTTRPYEFRFPGHNRLLVVGIPRRMLGVPRGLTSSITARRLTTTGGASRVVASFLRTVHAELDALSGGANEQRLAALLADMLDLMLGDLGVRRTELPAPMLERVLAFCDVNLSDPSLSASSIARTHRVSVRYLHKLFATVDETPAGYIRRRRLELVRRDLASPELAGVPVARLATRHGLSDAPHFSRLFRATYGCTPGDYRATALSAGSLLPRTGTPS